MRFNKVKGILRAKKGSQIPKYLLGAGFEWNGFADDGSTNYWDLAGIYDPIAKFRNPLTLGTTINKPMNPPTNLNLISNNPIGSSTLRQILNSHNWINLNLPDVENGAEWSQQVASLFALGQDSRPLWAMPQHLLKPLLQQTALLAIHGINADGTLNNSFTSFNPSMLNSDVFNIPKVGKPIPKPKNLIDGKTQGMVNAGIDIVMDKLTGGTKNSRAFDTVTNVTGTLKKVPGMVGWAATAADVLLKGANKLGAKKIDSHTLNTYYKTKMGSYNGMMALNNSVEANKDAEFGFFNQSGFNDALSDANKLSRQIHVATGIIDRAGDQFAMRDSSNKYNLYNGQVNGYATDPRTYALNSKQGGVLSTKLEILKSRKFKQVINLDTKQIEEFKEGGKIQTEWEPVIDISEEWEPEIILEIEEFKDGGSIKEELETPEIEETNLKNLIPEGALHKNKHHMEHTEGLTLKGIPVIDNNGDLQAEIELDEIIFTLEVTKKLEELYKDGSDEAAIEAGKLLVKEILFNTDDRTGLISKCEKGGKL